MRTVATRSIIVHLSEGHNAEAFDLWDDDPAVFPIRVEFKFLSQSSLVRRFIGYPSVLKEKRVVLVFFLCCGSGGLRKK